MSLRHMWHFSNIPLNVPTKIASSATGCTIALLTTQIFRYSSLPLFLPRLCSEICSWLQHLSGNPIWICWGRPRWLRHPGHTLIPVDLRAFFFPSFHDSLNLRRLSESCPARCLETRLLPVSHPAVASGERTAFFQARTQPGVFQDTSGEKKKKNQKISHGNQITPPLQTLAHSHTPCSH